MNININPVIAQELAYIVKLHQQYGAPFPAESVEDLVNTILTSIADGSRRPGAWERQLLDMMGLVADTDKHHQYRAHYGEHRGAPKDAG